MERTPEIVATIKAAVERARDHPLMWDMIKECALVDQTSGTVVTADNRKFRPYSEQVLLPNDHRLAISFEEQPAGMCLHLSLSVEAPGALPSPKVLPLVAEVAGVLERPDRAWLEEYVVDGQLGGTAVHMVFLLEGT